MNIVTLDEKVLSGPRPMSISDWDQLRHEKVTTVLNLERGWFEVLHGRLNEEFRCAVNRGMTPVHLELRDLRSPDMNDLLAALSILRDARYGKVYFHCLHGVDRTGMLRAMYRVLEQRWLIHDALGEMMRLGFHKFPYLLIGWDKRLTKFLTAMGKS